MDALQTAVQTAQQTQAQSDLAILQGAMPQIAVLLGQLSNPQTILQVNALVLGLNTVINTVQAVANPPVP